MRVITFKAPNELVEQMDYYARLLGITRSELIRAAIESFLKGKIEPPKIEGHYRTEIILIE